MKPTPIPWKTGTPGRGRFVVYSSALESHGRGICRMLNTQNISPEETVKYGEHELNLIADANAALIVQAVNHHAELVEALTNILGVIEAAIPTSREFAEVWGAKDLLARVKGDVR